MTLIIIKCLSANADIFPHQCKDISDGLEVKEMFLSPWYLILDKNNFQRGFRGCLLKRRNNGLSLEWMPGSILKLKCKSCVVSSQSSLHVCLF